MSFRTEGVVFGPGEGGTVQAPGHPITYKATRADTGGAYSLLEITISGDGPPQHVHNSEEEAFYVLAGEVSVKMGDETVVATPGTFVLVPRGMEHTFWRSSADEAKILAIFSPAGFEEYFLEIVGDAEIDTETFIERGRSVSQKYNLEITGPPLG